MDIAITIMENGAPNLKKSANLYPPGFITNIFTGDESGEINAVEDATATAISNPCGSMPII